MPRGDGTGPMGMGPMTGRAAGYCAGYPVPGYMNPTPGYGYGGAPAFGYGAMPYAPMGYAPYGAYGIGENIGASLSAITSSALYNAIGKWVLDFPITPDKVLKALDKA